MSVVDRLFAEGRGTHAVALQKRLDLTQEGFAVHEPQHSGANHTLSMGWNLLSAVGESHYKPDPMRLRHDWRARLTKLVEGKELRPIAVRAKLGPTYLRDVLFRNNTPTLPNAEKLSAALGVSINDWFIELGGPEPKSTQSGLRRPGENSSRNEHSRSVAPQEWPMDLPVVGWVDCGEDGLFELQGDVIEYVRRPPKFAGIPDAYVVYINGTSMVPWKFPRMRIYVHPRAAVSVGDFVVVELHPERAEQDPRPRGYVKRLKAMNNQRIVLEQYNPPKDIPLSRSRIKAIHRVFDLDELLGF